MRRHGAWSLAAILVATVPGAVAADFACKRLEVYRTADGEEVKLDCGSLHGITVGSRGLLRSENGAEAARFEVKSKPDPVTAWVVLQSKQPGCDLNKPLAAEFTPPLLSRAHRGFKVLSVDTNGNATIAGGAQDGVEKSLPGQIFSGSIDSASSSSRAVATFEVLVVADRQATVSWTSLRPGAAPAAGHVACVLGLRPPTAQSPPLAASRCSNCSEATVGYVDGRTASIAVGIAEGMSSKVTGEIFRQDREGERVNEVRVATFSVLEVKRDTMVKWEPTGAGMIVKPGMLARMTKLTPPDNGGMPGASPGFDGETKLKEIQRLSEQLAAAQAGGSADVKAIQAKLTEATRSRDALLEDKEFRDGADRRLAEARLQHEQGDHDGAIASLSQLAAEAERANQAEVLQQVNHEIKLIQDTVALTRQVEDERRKLRDFNQLLQSEWNAAESLMSDKQPCQAEERFRGIELRLKQAHDPWDATRMQALTDRIRSAQQKCTLLTLEVTSGPQRRIKR